MSSAPPKVIPRKHSAVKVLAPLREQPRPGVLSILTENGAIAKSSHSTPMNAESEVEILNHCFDDMERFMTRLQQAAEAQSILNQRTKRSGKKSTKDVKQGGDLLTKKAQPPPEQEFVDIFQKIKYSLCLLDRLKSSISQPDAPELLHHIFVPLRLLVKTTGGPSLGASVASPAMTRGAVSLLQEHLTEEEKELWTSLGPKWTSPGSQLSVSAPPYSPVFLDGWQPQAYDSAGQLLEDPIQLQHKEEASSESRQKQSQQERSQTKAVKHREETEDVFDHGCQPDNERLFCCSYDFVASNNQELSVLHGEVLEVLDQSQPRWTCRNKYNEVGVVPSNILEPLSAVNGARREHPVFRTESKRVALTPRTKCFSYAPSSNDGISPVATSPTERTRSMIIPSNFMMREDGDRVMIMNDELLQRLAKKRNSLEQIKVPSTAGVSVPLNYQSSKDDVRAWLTAKGFSETTVRTLGVLNGAQLFSLTNEELHDVCSLEGEGVFLHILGQKALLKDMRF